MTLAHHEIHHFPGRHELPPPSRFRVVWWAISAWCRAIVEAIRARIKAREAA
jgi:hypothetical protein